MSQKNIEMLLTRLRLGPVGGRPGSAMQARTSHQASLQEQQHTQKRAQPQRPHSALTLPKEKLQASVRQQMRQPVERWGVLEVCNWVEVLGLPQHRKRFLHQGINGQLLLKLNHTLLKVKVNVPYHVPLTAIERRLQVLKAHNMALGSHTVPSPAAT